MRTWWVWTVLGGGLLATAPSAAATATAAEVLERVDEVVNRADDAFYEYAVTTKEPGKPAREIVFQVFMLKNGRRRLDFVAPGDIKGTRILIESADQMYVYLPAFRKVRRLAGHVKEQGFMGTSFSQDEMGIARYGEHFRPTGVEPTSDGLRLSLMRKDGSELPYAKVIMLVEADTYRPLTIEYWNDNGVHQKTEVRSDFVCDEDVCTPKKVEMIDHTRGELTSHLTMTRRKINAGIPEKFFTLRALQRR